MHALKNGVYGDKNCGPRDHCLALSKFSSELLKGGRVLEDLEVLHLNLPSRKFAQHPWSIRGICSMSQQLPGRWKQTSTISLIKRGQFS